MDGKLLGVGLLVLLVQHFASGDVDITNPSGDKLDVLEGEAIELVCTAPSGDTIQWSFSGMPITAGDGTTIEETESGGAKISTLTRQQATGAQSGNYQCKNPDDYFDSDSVTVTVGGEFQELTIVEPDKETIEVASGAQFRLKCVGEADAITWKHNGMPLTESSKIIVTSSIDINTRTRTSLLTRQRVAQIEAGTYACTDDGDLFNSDSIEVVITQASAGGATAVEISEPPQTPHRVTIGHQPIRIKCKAGAGVTLAWFHNDQRLTDGQGGYSINDATESGSKTSFLTKDMVEAADAGQYKCQNNADATDYDFVEIRAVSQGSSVNGLQSAPAPPSARQKIYLRVRSSMNLECDMAAQSNTVTVWSKGGTNIEQSAKYSISTDNSKSILTISNTEREDEGVYTCKFEDSQSGQVAAVVHFDVTAQKCPSLTPPANGSFDSCPEQPVYGETCSFKCDSGFQLADPKVLACDEFKDNKALWNGKVSECKRKGSFFSNLFNHGSQATSSFWIIGLLVATILLLRQ